MTRITRRDFLHHLATAGFATLAGSWFLGGCGQQQTPTQTSKSAPTSAAATPPQPTPTGILPSPTTTAQQTSAPTAVAHVEYPHVAVARGGQPEQLGGICEYKCPVSGEAAIRVYAPGSNRLS